MVTRAKGAAWTARAQAAFLAEFTRCGNVFRSCQAAKVGRRTVYDWLAADERFKVLYAQAAEDAVDQLEEEARRRAVDGWLEPVFQGGEEVGMILKHSDSLLTMLLKGRRKEVFSERYEHTGKDGGPIRGATIVRYYPASMRPEGEPDELPPPSDEEA